MESCERHQNCDLRRRFPSSHFFFLGLGLESSSSASPLTHHQSLSSSPSFEAAAEGDIREQRSPPGPRGPRKNNLKFLLRHLFIFSTLGLFYLVFPPSSPLASLLLLSPLVIFLQRPRRCHSGASFPTSNHTCEVPNKVPKRGVAGPSARFDDEVFSGDEIGETRRAPKGLLMAGKTKRSVLYQRHPLAFFNF